MSWYRRIMTQETVGTVVGENLKRLRLSTDLSQSDVARSLNEHGLDWNRDQVSLLEIGKRGSIGVDELLVMSWTFDVTLSYWFEGVGEIQLTPSRQLEDRERIRRSLQGRKVKDGTFIEVDFSEAEDTSADDSIARSMGIESEAVQRIAVELWGHTATTERDRRLSEHKGKTPKELRTLRGGMTKRLRREIEQAMS